MWAHLRVNADSSSYDRYRPTESLILPSKRRFIPFRIPNLFVPPPLFALVRNATTDAIDRSVAIHNCATTLALPIRIASMLSWKGSSTQSISLRKRGKA